MSIRKGEVSTDGPNIAAHLAVADDGLPPNVKFERREDKFGDVSFWKVEKLSQSKKAPGPDTRECRLDSPKDRDMIAKGGTPWYMQYVTVDTKGAK